MTRGRLIVTRARQAAAAPIVDGAIIVQGELRHVLEEGGISTTASTARRYGGYLILPPLLWLRRRCNRPAARGLSIGWLNARSPQAPGVLLRRARRRAIERLFRRIVR